MAFLMLPSRDNPRDRLPHEGHLQMVALALLCLVVCAIACCIRIEPLNKFSTDHVRGGQVWLTRVLQLVDFSAWLDEACRSTWPPRVAEVAAEHDDWRLSDQIKLDRCHLPTLHASSGTVLPDSRMLSAA